MPFGVTLLSWNTRPEIYPNVLIVNSAFAGSGLLPKFVRSSPAGMLFVCTPGVDAVTSTLMVQPLTGIVAPFAYVIVPLPAFAVTVPGHVFVMLGVPATTTLPGAVGSVSVKSEVSVIVLSLSLPR